MDGDEQRVAVRLDLGPLVRVVRVFDGEVVQAEFFLQLVEDALVGLIQTNPDEAAVVDGEHVADRVEADVAALAVAAVGHAVHDALGECWILHAANRALCGPLAASRFRSSTPARSEAPCGAELARLLFGPAAEKTRAAEQA